MKSMPTLIEENELEKRYEILKALAHPLRLQIIHILATSERSVGSLVKIIGAKQSNTSQQLSILKYRGIIKARRVGNVVYYSVNNQAARGILNILDAHAG